MSKTSKNLVVTIDPVVQKPDVDLVKQLERTYQSEPTQNKLVGSDGVEIPLSDAAFEVIKKILTTLESRRALITIAPASAELSTQQAADALNVSRPYLIKLLDKGELDYVMVGSHRRIRSKDLEEYQTKRNSQRRHALNELVELMEEEGGVFD